MAAQELDENHPRWADLERTIGYTFRDRSLLICSMTHSSMLFNRSAMRHNQRMEFLGDAVLGLVLAEKLFHLLPSKREGDLTRNRSILVSGVRLAEMARVLRIPEFVMMSEGEINNGGRERNSILEDAFEALIAAIYLDSDYPTARDCIIRWYGDLKPLLLNLVERHNPKGSLQEKLQPLLGNGAIEYLVSKIEGPDHQREFDVEVRIEGRVWGVGRGSSKKEAEEMAAQQALEKLEQETPLEHPESEFSI
jgi:ribonuclease-3